MLKNTKKLMSKISKLKLQMNAFVDNKKYIINSKTTDSRFYI